MRTRRIGTLEVSVVGVGCNNFGGRIGADAVTAVVDAAIAEEINFFDTADIYGGGGASEELLGRALGDRRDEVVVATKFGGEMGGGSGASASYVKRAADASLARLGTDRIDLYQLHFPDAATPLAETLGALDELVTAGKVREIGCSNFGTGLLAEAWAAVEEGRTGFVSVQNQLSLLRREDEAEGVLEAERLGLAYLPYFPLASGLLTGKYRRGEPPPEGTRLAGNPRSAEVLSDAAFDVIDGLTAFAEERGHTLLDLAFAWLLAHHPVASVIAGATRPEQIAANAAAGGEWELSEADLAAIEAIAGGGEQSSG